MAAHDADAELQLQLTRPLVAENASLFAADFVEQGRSQGIPLDYSPGSLTVLDQIIGSLRAEGVRAAQVADVLFGFGCYLGETIVRAEGARWVTSAGTPLAAISVFPIVVRRSSGAFSDPVGQPFAALLSGASLLSFYVDTVSQTG
jgi:hypothetical protein